MPTKKYQQKLMKQKICSIARVVACASFLVLAVIGVSSLVRAMSLEKINHQNGIPTAWNVASLGRPDTITVPITYWDQREDQCWTDGKKRNNNDYRNMSATQVDKLLVKGRQFEWSYCGIYGEGAQQGLVKDTLGADGLPVPAFANVEEAKKKNVHITSQFVNAENFYRWFHEVDGKSQRISDKTITFTRSEGNSYTYGGSGTDIYPLDGVGISGGDVANTDDHGVKHNFHFTAHLRIPVKIEATGQETFKFAGDDDVWVFLNGKLVMDLGGVHTRLTGSFTVNTDGTVSAVVDDGKNSTNRNNINVGLKAGDVVNLDFFYAERSTTQSNTLITIENMNWPISADSRLNAEIVGQDTETLTSLVQYDASIRNRDPENPLLVNRLAAYINDKSLKTEDTEAITNEGFIPLDARTLQYSTNPSDENSWKTASISKPQNSADGFTFDEPFTLAPYGQSGDTLYFRYFAETNPGTGNIYGKVSFLTSLYGNAGVAYDSATAAYSVSKPEETEPKKYTTTIEYMYEDGGTAADSFSVTDVPGTEFTQPSPVIEGYTPDQTTVKGVIEDKDTAIDIIYHPNNSEETPSETENPDENENPENPETPDENPDENPEQPENPENPDEGDDQKEEPTTYNLTIKYVYADGSEADKPYTNTLVAGTDFNVPSPEIDFFEPDQDSVAGVISDRDIEITVTYTKKRVKHTITVRYEYADHSEAAESAVRELYPDEEYSIDSPEIDGYTPNELIIAGTMGDDSIAYVVTYTKDKEKPVAPAGPTIIPTVPVINTRPSHDDTVASTTTPSVSDNNDGLEAPLPPLGEQDELTYLPPLGEVAFVPNTGIVSDIVAPIFEQYFADFILSQGFVMIVLLVFSGSFATYFSLRRYLNIEPTTRRVRKTPQMPKNLKSPAKKSASQARTQQVSKSSVKSAKSTTKVQKSKK